MEFTPEVRIATDPIYQKISKVMPEIEWSVHAPYIHRINQLKKEKNAIILAHNYQTPEIYHGIADVAADSLALAIEASKTEADIIVMAGVHFMAETSKLMSPEKKVSSNYQAGALSFEIISNGKKLICNSGYFQSHNHQLNELSKSSAIHSTLTLDDRSSCKFNKNKNESSKISHGLKILKKNIVFEKNYWKINASHDGYLRQYDVIHEREVEFYPEQIKFIGHDKIIFKNSVKNLKFEIRFHLEPNIKIMKTQDNKSILIDLDGEGWKFNSANNDMNIDNGLYFGKKNSFVDNHNIVISGMTNDENQTIKWEITKI